MIFIGTNTQLLLFLLFQLLLLILYWDVNFISSSFLSREHASNGVTLIIPLPIHISYTTGQPLNNSLPSNVSLNPTFHHSKWMDNLFSSALYLIEISHYKQWELLNPISDWHTGRTIWTIPHVWVFLCLFFS